MNLFQKGKGFTLIELLIVIAIISVLVLIVLAALNESRAHARDAKRMEELHSFEIGLSLYYDKYGMYPCGDSNEPTINPHYDMTKITLAEIGTVDGTGSCGSGGPNDYGFLNGNGNGGNATAGQCDFFAQSSNIGLYTEGFIPTSCAQDPRNNVSSPNMKYIYQVTKDRQRYLLSTYLESVPGAVRMTNDGGRCSDAYETGTLLGVAMPRYPGVVNLCT